MYEVELTKETNALLDHYKAEYQKRYKRQPIVPSLSIAMADIRAVLSMLTSYAEAEAVITHYLKTDGVNDWFKRQGHSTECLKKNVIPLSTQIGKTVSKGAEGGGLRLQIIRNCDIATCDTRFTWFGTPDEIQDKCYCLAHGD